MKDPGNILILRLGGIGEIIAITPALRALRARWPRARVTLMAERHAVDLLGDAGWVDEFLLADSVYRAAGVRWTANPRFYIEMIRVVERLTARPFDLFLSFNHLYYLRSLWKPLLFGLLSRAPRRVGFDSYRRGFFLTDRVPDDRAAERHLIYRNREFLWPLGIELNDVSTRVPLRPADGEAARRLLSEAGVAEDAFLIGVNPGSSRPATRWNEGRFIEALRRLGRPAGTRIVFVGSDRERGLCGRIAAALEPPGINLAGRTSLGTLIALVRRFRLFLSNDTGPLHIAHALEVPTVGIFRPGEYPIWGAYRERERFIGLHRPVPCAPCYRYTCDHHTCMVKISVEDVVRAAEQLLGSRPG